MSEAGVVVVGAGQAGAAAVLRLRANGYAGAVTLVGDENVLPYQRPPLSKKYLTGEFERERLLLRRSSDYQNLNIQLRVHSAAAKIDRDRNTIYLADRTGIPYSSLVLTTGATAINLAPPLLGEFKNVYTFRTLADADRLQKEMRSDRRLLIVGGGYIGLEMAAVAQRIGMNVTLVEQADRILKRVAAPETSTFVRDLHMGRGVQILESRSIIGLEGVGQIANTAALDDGQRIPFDWVVVGIGVRPSTELAQTAGLAVENGIVIDDAGRTSDPLIFAAGDCANFPYRGRRIRLESVQNAIEQAEHVADVICGKARGGYCPVPWFWSDQFDSKLQIAGLNTGYDQIICRQGSRLGATSVWYFREEEFLAIDAINEPRAYMLGKRLLEAGASPDPKKLADPTVDLKTLL